MIFYSMYYVSSMTYSLSVGTLSMTQASKIQGSTTQKFLCKIGYNRNLPTAVAYGPVSLGGIGLRDLFINQGAEKSLFVLRMLRIDRPVSKIIKIYLLWSQKVSGVSYNILEYPSIILPQLQEEKWITTFREFLSKSNLQIKIVNLFEASYQRTNDKYLMDQALNMNLKITTIQKINRCRIYLKVTTISDITNANGSHITLGAYNCNENSIINNSGEWPVQMKPGPKHIRIWKRFLNELCIGNNLKLEFKLYSWITSKIHINQNHQTFVNNNRTTAYIKIKESWHKAALQHKRNRCKLINIQQISTEEINIQEYIPCDCTYNINKQYTIQWSSKDIISNNNIVNDINSWKKYILTIHAWEQVIIKNITMNCTIDEFNNILLNTNESLIVVSDGGCIQNIGSFGWVMGTNEHELIQGRGTVPGSPMSSHRAEGIGKLSWLVYIKHYLIFNKLNIKCKVTSYCDNKAIVDQTGIHIDYTRSKEAMDPNYDVLRTIQVYKKN